MNPGVKDALGDLAVSIVELRKKPTPPWVRSRMTTFANWYAYGAPFFHQVIDVGLTVVRSGRAPTSEELAPLTAAFLEARHVVDLMEQSYVAFEYIGYDEGYFYGGAPWLKLCEWRSAARFLSDFGLTMELEETDDGLERWGHELFEQLAVPPDMPRSHWWWFSERP